jgi:hypothetical protein
LFEAVLAVSFFKDEFGGVRRVVDDFDGFIEIGKLDEGNNFA